MKRLLFISLFLALACTARAEEVADSTAPFVSYQSSGTINLSTSTYLYASTMTWRGDGYWDSPATYTFIDSWHGKDVTILRIDGDGDIFLRGKWIAWDWRLSKQYRDTGRWIELPKETAIPGNQGAQQ